MSRAPYIGNNRAAVVTLARGHANRARRRPVEMSAVPHVSHWPLNARVNSIMVEVSFSAKMRAVHRALKMDGGNREEEDSCDSIWHWADRRVDRAADAGKTSH
jgi:hypothetical protein